MPKSKQSGFSLIELVVVVAIIGVLAAVSSALYLEGLQTYSAGNAASTVLSDLRFALNHMVTDLRGANDVQVVSPTVITYRSTEAPFERQFRLVGTAIQRYDNQPICSFVHSLTFVLQDGILTIEIISVDSVDGNALGSGLPYTLSTTLKLRN